MPKLLDLDILFKKNRVIDMGHAYATLEANLKIVTPTFTLHIKFSIPSQSPGFNAASVS